MPGRNVVQGLGPCFLMWEDGAFLKVLPSFASPQCTEVALRQAYMTGYFLVYIFVYN